MLTDQNFTIEQGATRAVKAKYDFDVTGAFFKFGLKRRKHQKEYDLLKETNDGITVNTDEKIIEIKFDPDDTANIEGNYFYELWIRDNFDNKTPVIRGQVKIEKSVVQM